jgi:glycosyltransferase involved in cell wall biosynthesis
MSCYLSIIIPVYKNAPTLMELHLRLTRVLRDITDAYEILFIDDACPAGSADVLRKLASLDSRVGVLLLAHNVGQNRAVMTGLAHARGNLAVVMDADLQDPPEAIPALVAALIGNTAAVFAGRRGHYEGRGRLMTSLLFKLVLHLLSGRRIPPDAGLFVTMRRDTITQLLAFDAPDPYVIGLMGRTRLPLRSIPVVRSPNNERESAYTRRTRVALAWRAIRQMLPLRTLMASAAREDQSPVIIREYVGARFDARIHEQEVILCTN